MRDFELNALADDAGKQRLSDPTSLSAAAPGADVSAAAQSERQWREAMQQTRLPKKGCFHASHPDPAWHEVECGKAPPVPMGNPPIDADQARIMGVEPQTVGSGTGFMLKVTNPMTQVVGSFPTVSGVTSETDGTANGFSLQINSNLFATAACSGGGPNCLGWQQFVFSNTGNGASSLIYIQYWLVNFGNPGNPCPAGYIATSPPHCYKNSSTATIPAQTIGNLANLTLRGNAATGDTLGQDLVTLFRGSTVDAATSDNILSLAPSWNSAEFNIFGNGNSKQANFNVGSTLAIRMLSTNGTSVSPTCTGSGGVTAETNNLNLVTGSCCINGGASPGINFLETNAAGVKAPFCVAKDLIPMLFRR